MNRKERRAAQKLGGPAITPMAATLAQAFRAHQAGHRSDAERLYRDVLAAEPRNASALHLLGALLHQGARSDEAVSLIRQAIAIEPRNPDYHCNLGSILLQSGRAGDAIAHLKTAVELKSDYAEAHFELGNALARVARWPESAAEFRRVVALRPTDHAAQNNLALVLREQGSLDEAAALWERIVAAVPSFALAHMNLGLAYKAMGRLADAETSLRQAIELQPNLPEGHYNLASVQIEQDNGEGALQSLRRAFEARDTDDTRRLFIRCVTTNSQIPLDPELEPLLYRALAEDWANPQFLYVLCRAYLGVLPPVEAALKRAETAQPDPLPLNQLLGPEGPDHIGQNRLLLELLASTPVKDTIMERLLRRIRFALLDALRRLGDNESLGGCTADLGYAIARQCFVNEYIFDETPEERSMVEMLVARTETALRNGRTVAPEAIAIIAAYQPLHTTRLGALLADYDAPAPLAAVLDQQIKQPLAEQALRGSIASLTPIGEGVSTTVRRQYEENPYPRWLKASRLESPVPIDRFLKEAFPHAPYRPLNKSADLEVLIAGCGTGQHAINTAQKVSAAEILAVDLSRASLAFAERQTQALGITNIRYGQADIAYLASLGRTFDLIEAVGVLHHLGDPWEGWRTLLSLLRPQGVMRIGLYSAMAHRDIVLAQDFVRTGNYQADHEGIRTCRRHLLRQQADSPLRKMSISWDFFTTSECRDLLFNVQEQRFSLPEIASFLTENRLTFLGFDLPVRTFKRYSEEYTHDGAACDLASWHEFETNNPSAFASMYNFFVQSP